MDFAMIGVAGYIAPRHLRAIRDTGHRLVACVDPNDSVGVLDRYFHDVAYFREFERFDRHVEKMRRAARPISYVSICSPNYLHDAHIRFALRSGAHAICEKPLVMNPWNCEPLAELEAESGRRVFTVLQLRLHPAVLALRDKYRALGRRCRVELTYLTTRGPWYHYSWKGIPERSGGLATNIGIHFFDMLLWIFGSWKGCEVYRNDPSRLAGRLVLEGADVDWQLSIALDDLPPDVRAAGRTTYRSLRVDDEEYDLSEGFTELHTRVYEDILAGGGYGIADALPSIEAAHRIRTATVVAMPPDFFKASGSGS